MEMDRELLEKIRLLDDESLRRVIGNVAEGMGLDAKMTAPYLADMGKIKETVAGLSQEDLDRIQGAIGEENTKNLMTQIQKEVKGQ